MASCKKCGVGTCSCSLNGAGLCASCAQKERQAMLPPTPPTPPTNGSK